VSDSEIIIGEAPVRYAGALMDLAEETKSLKTVEKDLKKLKALLTKNEALRDMTANPVYATDDKVNALLAIAKKAKLGKLVTNFVGTVTKNRRAHELPAMISAFEKELASRRGYQIAKVTSAQKLTTAQITKLKASLKKSLGQAIDIETDVDPDLIGGFVVRIGSRLYDSSLKTKIEDLKLALKEV